MREVSHLQVLKLEILTINDNQTVSGSSYKLSTALCVIATRRGRRGVELSGHVSTHLLKLYIRESVVISLDGEQMGQCTKCTDVIQCIT